MFLCLIGLNKWKISCPLIHFLIKQVFIKIGIIFQASCMSLMKLVSLYDENSFLIKTG